MATRWNMSIKRHSPPRGRYVQRYEGLGIEEVFMLCAIGPAQHQEVLHTIQLFGEQVIPHFQAKTPRTVVAQTSA
jgi:hypothetical protein